MEWVSVAFGNAKYKMAANMASKMAAVITKISKTTDFSTVFAPRSALLWPRLFDHEIINPADSFNYKFCTPRKQQKWLNVNQCA